MCWSRKWQPTPVGRLENSMDRRAWQATVRGIAKSQTLLNMTHITCVCICNMCVCILCMHTYIHMLLLHAAKSLQSCLTLWDPIDSSPPGSAIPGILQARTLEWVAISFSNAWKWKAKVKSLSRVWLLATLWTAAYQAPPSMGFSRQEY